MLTPSTTAVKLDLPLTPEQQACSMHIDQGLKTFWSLVEHLQHAADEHQPIDQVEETIFRDLLVIGRWMLQAFLDFAGTGDIGPTLTVSGDSASDADQELPRLDQPRKRPYLSIFGEIDIERICYGHDRVEAAPLDAQLHLPQRQYSYLFQRWLGAFVVDDAHAEAIRKLGTILGLEIAVKASEDLNREQASDVEVFQDSLPVPAAEEEGPLLVVTADCKGVPLVRKAVPEIDEPGGPSGSSGHGRSSGCHRRGKGEKANKKQMAAVGAVYTIKPFVRTADDVIEEVMRKEARQRRPSPQNKRVRAELLVGKVALFLWLAQETIRRNPQGSKPVIFLSDGERALHDRQSEYLPENTICILDLFHVLERLWKVAWCFFEERTQKRAGPSVGGKASEKVAGGESGLRDPRDAVPGNPRRFEGPEEENCPGRGGLFRAEPGSDEVRRVLGGRLSDWQRGRRGSVSASGQGSDGAYGNALAPIRRSGDAGSASNLP